MTKAEDLEMAGEFASSTRGKYVISKALHLAIKELTDVPSMETAEHFERKQDLEDMEYLRKEIFNSPIGFDWGFGTLMFNHWERKEDEDDQGRPQPDR
jgi:hypothetical protein